MMKERVIEAEEATTLALLGRSEMRTGRRRSTPHSPTSGLHCSTRKLNRQRTSVHLRRYTCFNVSISILICVLHSVSLFYLSVSQSIFMCWSLFVDFGEACYMPMWPYVIAYLVSTNTDLHSELVTCRIDGR